MSSSSLTGPPLPVLSFGNLDPPAPSSLPPFPTLVLPSASTCTQATDAPMGAARGDFASSSSSPNLPQPTLPDLQHVARCVLKAKRIAVVCGAGISTASGIPDFRSSAGLFESLKKQYPDARLSSGKDLFDVGLFASEQNAAIFYNMIAELKKQTDAVEPTAFHGWLKELDDQGKLFRVYTQNIDALEERAGLTYGLGDTSLPLPPRRAPRSPTKAPRPSAAAVRAPSPTPTPSSSRLQPTSSQSSLSSCSFASESSSYPTPRPSPSPPPPPPAPTHSTIPRCIPLHGHLSTLSCSHCSLTTPLAPFLPLLSAGQGPACPRCMEIESARFAAGDRSRGVGVLKPDVVLYGEEHKDGERVGEITRRDLMGQRPDLLLVVGTTLKVKGTKRLVRELSKVIKPAPREPAEDEELEMPSSSLASNASTSSASKKRPRTKPPPKMHTLYLNYDFPTPSRDWAGVFDCWLRGDIQEFVRAVKDEEERMAGEAGGKGKGKGKVPAAAAGKKAPTTKKAEAKAGAKGGGKTKTPSGAGKPRQTLIKAQQAPLPNTEKRSPGPLPPSVALPSLCPPQPVVEIPRPRPAPRDRSLTPGARSSAQSAPASAATSGRRSARSSTVQATQSSLAKAGGAGRVQRLGFVVTKRSVGSVTGTGKAK
ncbi:hypothetical protein JCM21900_004937 [Sporobolomyces salmonicolor]